MKLNPNKCVFGVMTRKFQGFMVSQRGIEVNSEKIQSLNGKITTLNRFVSRVTYKCLPFFRTLRKSFDWKKEFQKAFEDLKAYLSSLPLLSPSKLGEELFLYLAISPVAVSATLVKEEEGVQKLVYFTS